MIFVENWNSILIQSGSGEMSTYCTQKVFDYIQDWLRFLRNYETATKRPKFLEKVLLRGSSKSTNSDRAIVSFWIHLIFQLFHLPLKYSNSWKMHHKLFISTHSISSEPFVTNLLKFLGRPFRDFVKYLFLFTLCITMCRGGTSKKPCIEKGNFQFCWIELNVEWKSFYFFEKYNSI